MIVYAYISTRMQFPTRQTVEDAIKILEKCGVERSALVGEVQSDCQFCPINMK
jgi:hypothetical protein